MTITDFHMATDPPSAAQAHRRARILGVLAGVLVAALLIAGCGGSSSDGGLAHLNSSTTAKTSTKSSSKANGLAYAQCMRSHGVPQFPDIPSSGGGPKALPTGINPNSPSFQAAAKDCKSLAPISGVSPSQSSKTMAAALKFATCMQKNGVPNYPDPKTVNNGAALQESLGSGVDPNSPAFQRAQQKCNRLVPPSAQAGGS